MSAISNGDITFVIQGPVSFHNDINVTEKCIDSIKTNFPGAPIILSTWPSNYSRSDILVLYNQDPGEIDTTNRYFKNYNRMVVGTHNGLLAVRTKYAVRLRSDFWLDSTSCLKDALDKIDSPNVRRFGLAARVLMGMSYDRNPLFPYYISDIFHAGFQRDLLQIWNGKLVENKNNITICRKSFLASCLYAPLYKCDVSERMDYPFHSEQQLCLDFLLRIGIKFRFSAHDDVRFFEVIQSYKVLSQVFLAWSSYELGLRSYKYPVPHSDYDCVTWKLAEAYELNIKAKIIFLLHLLRFFVIKHKAYIRVMIRAIKKYISLR